MATSFPETLTASPDQSVSAVARKRRVAPVARLVAALAITYGVLIYAWGRTLLEGVLINGNPKPLYVWMLVGGIAAVMGLTAGLSRHWSSPKVDRRVLRGAVAWWILSIAIGLTFVTGSLLPQIIIIPMFVLASLWVPCLAWMFYRPWGWLPRMATVAACVSLQVGFVGLLRVEGIQGGFLVDYMWRGARRFEPGSELSAVVAPSTAEKGTPKDSRASDDDYPQFLGPNRSAVVGGRNLSADWTATPPREIWRIAVGAGWSGFAVAGDHAVTQEQRGPKECVVCYRLANGQPVWVHSDDARCESSMGGIGPRATPAIDGGRVYSVGGTGLLNCIDIADGKAVWTVNILQDNGGREVGHGVCGSPLVTDKWVIVSPTAVSGASLVAYDKMNGQRVWQGGKSVASYGSPAVAELAGVPQVLLVTHDGIEGNDLRTGKPLWDFAWAGDLNVNCSQPVIVDAQAGRVLYGTGYGKGCVLLEVTAGKDGTCGVRDVWQSPGKLKTKFTTAVLHKGHAYGLDDGILACLDLQTGKQLWKGGRFAHGQILLAGDLLIVQAEAGDVFLVQPDPEKLIELGKIPALSSKTWNNPALAGNKLLVRNDREAVCYELPVRATD
jgi:outer membrane protein assembly factor BamB